MKLPLLKIQLAIFLVLFAFYLSVVYRDAAFLLTILIAVSSAILVDLTITYLWLWPKEAKPRFSNLWLWLWLCLKEGKPCLSVLKEAKPRFSYLKTKRFIITESSVISGLIIGYVLASNQPWWIFSLASLFAIVSKHLICINKKHLFNPAAFGIFSVIILFGASTQWKGADLWYILVPAGIYFVSKIRKIEVVIGYMTAFLVLFGTQAIIQQTSLLNVLIYQNFFFIFIMLIEPKTTPVSRKGKAIFGVAAAVLIFILAENHVKFDAELCSLLTLNLFSPLLNKLP